MIDFAKHHSDWTGTRSESITLIDHSGLESSKVAPPPATKAYGPAVDLYAPTPASQLALLQLRSGPLADAVDMEDLFRQNNI